MQTLRPVNSIQKVNNLCHKHMFYNICEYSTAVSSSEIQHVVDHPKLINDSLFKETCWTGKAKL